MPELQHAWDMFPTVRALVRVVAAGLDAEIARATAAEPALTPLWAAGSGSPAALGTSLVGWLEGGAAVYPSDALLRSAPLSFPLIGLTQVAGVAAAVAAAGLAHPGELVALSAGATGHSQGVVTAVAVAGGFTYRAVVDHASVVRAANNVAHEGTVTPLSFIAPGDVVTVFERRF